MQLPRLYLTWITPAHLEPGDAELDVLSLLLAGGKNSRLYKRLVYDLQIAQDVAAFQASKALNSEYQIVVTARRRATTCRVDRPDPRDRRRGDRARSSRRRRPRASSGARSTRSSRRSTTAWSASATFGGVGDQLNSYYTATGNPGYFNEDLSRYRALSPQDIQAMAQKFLPLTKRVELVVEPVK